MSKIIDRTGKGANISQSENDANLDSLHGINQGVAGAAHTVDISDQGDTLEFTSGSAVAVTLDSIATILAAAHTSDFHVTIIAIGTGTVVTITPDALDAINTGVATIVLSENEYITIETDSTNNIWNIIGRDHNVVDRAAISTNAADIATNAADIATNAADIATNAADIATNAADIATNTADIATNTAKIAGLNTKIINIGDWDMDADTAVNVAHGLSDYTKFRIVTATIISDAGTANYDFGSANNGLDAGNHFIKYGSTNITLSRAANGFFDNVFFDDTPLDRGWITIQYLD